jgi:hypothetical protein
VRERWFGSTGHKVPAITLEGDLELRDALVLDSVDDLETLREAHEQGRPVVVRAAGVEEIKHALARPEVASVIVPTQELRELDLTELTYG